MNRIVDKIEDLIEPFIRWSEEDLRIPFTRLDIIIAIVGIILLFLSLL